MTVDDTVSAGTVQLVTGGDYNVIGQAVTAPEPSTDGTYAGTERTSTDTSCIYRASSSTRFARALLG